MDDEAPDPARPLADARKALDLERPAAARDALRALVAARPDAAEGWLQLARAEAATGDAAAARAAFERCLDLAPTEPVAWLELAIFEGAQGRGGAVVKRARRAAPGKTLTAMVQDAASGQGSKALGTGAATRADLAALSKAAAGGDLRAVEARAAPLLRARPGAVVWGMLAQARLDAGRPGPAAEAFRQGLRLEPYAVDLRLGLVKALTDAGAVPDALTEARRAAQGAPLSARAQVIHGRVALQAGLADRAARIAEAVLARHPAEDAALTLAAEAAMQAGRGEAAVAFARSRGPGARGRDLLLARTLERAGRSEEALAAHDALLAADPGNAAALAARGQLRQTLGLAEGAEADLRAAIAADPDDGTAYRALAYGTRLGPDDPAVAAMRAAQARGRLDPASGRLIDYALARALQPSDPAAAARHLARANAAMLRAYPYDPQATRDLLARATRGDWPALRAARAAGAVSACAAAPIFVTGLPRSGTTLIETILASHPAVVAGGELAVLRRRHGPLRDALADGAPITSEMLTEAGDHYAAEAARRAGESAKGRLTDKSIFSFLEIGLIRTILPRAHVVVVTRDPRDTGLSIWRNHFQEGTHRYAASQDGIADQIALFHEALAFWEAELPGAVHRIAYEDLLDDPEGRSRALLAACDLPWDPAVLSFHEGAAAVRTLSFAQVRQPLYRSSRGGWRRSEEEIRPLIDALAAKGLLPD